MVSRTFWTPASRLFLLVATTLASAGATATLPAGATASGAAASSSSPVVLDIDFASFLARANPEWEYNSTSGMPNDWTQSLFGGNGDLGFMLFASSLTTLRLNVNRQTLWDDRTPDLGYPSYMGNFAYDQPRLPCGHFEISWTSGATPSKVSGRVILHDGTATVNVSTPSGECSLAVWASAQFDSSETGGADVIVIEASNTGTERCVVEYVAEPAQSTWASHDQHYVYNPPAANLTKRLNSSSTLRLISQPHLKGTYHSQAVLETLVDKNAHIVFTVSPVLSSQAAADRWADQEVKAAAAAPAAVRAAHLRWWHEWWPQGGFVTFDFSTLEAFWFIQMYKMVSGARAGRTVHDLEGPWFIPGTNWPDLHWDMNLQQTYYLPITANRPDIASTLTDYLEYLHGTGNLNTNVPAQWQHDSAAAPTGASSLSGNETCYWNYGANCTTSPPSVTGNLLWVLSVVHMTSLYTANTSIDTQVVLPVLDRALQFYHHFQVEREDGSIHLPVTFSPEYPGPPGADANYDLALYRYSLSLAIQICEDHQASSCSHLPQWRDTLAKLTGFSIDYKTDTFEIYDGVPYSTPHRHYSHLFMIWPLRLLDVTNQSQYNTARNSINLWLATPETDSMFYRPAASAMNALLGQHAAAFDNITYLLHHRIEGSTWYREGAQGSCTETPYAAAWAVTDWLVQSWNRTSAVPGVSKPVRVIDFFPTVDDIITLSASAYEAAPAKVATAAFYRLMVEGGVLASAARVLEVHNSTHLVTRTSFIAVESTAGGVVVVRTNLARPLGVSPAHVKLTEIGDGELVVVHINAGEGAALFSLAAPVTDFTISAAAGCPDEFNYWGKPAAWSERAHPSTKPIGCDN